MRRVGGHHKCKAKQRLTRGGGLTNVRDPSAGLLFERGFSRNRNKEEVADANN